MSKPKASPLNVQEIYDRYGHLSPSEAKKQMSDEERQKLRDFLAGSQSSNVSSELRRNIQVLMGGRMNAVVPKESERTSEKIFKRVFGVPSEYLSGQQLLIVLVNFYDHLQALKTIGMMEESYHNRGYFQRAEIKNWQDWRNKVETAKRDLKEAMEAAQPFLNKDISFLLRLEKGYQHIADSRTLTEVWKPTETGTSDSITSAEQDILNGQIGKK